MNIDYVIIHWCDFVHLDLFVWSHFPSCLLCLLDIFIWVVEEVHKLYPTVVVTVVTRGKRKNIKCVHLPVTWPFLYRITAYLHIIELWSTFFLFLRHLRSPCSYSVLISASIWSERLNQSRITKWNTMRCLCCEDETVLLFVHCVVSVRQSHILEVKYGSFILRWE